ncbi:hypothetical protein LEP1GSC045_0441 [Leptospira interrogans serovar Pomona str. Kennewicki LC82-25]|nr:hypothetical protein LEP1GSC045_0441 [Leptospira interrogans serovar Pomona str. Kennewicki LC82-25]EMF33402.1 hypothetical protein LEP1GSC201_4314 [Leptospira interrogans serovar Pomona str. Fox 32256]EMJ61522.1 hypothetical protein LEP1GSC197_4259 [Leptospira interrogans serovar Pomona str. CSL4002]
MSSSQASVGTTLENTKSKSTAGSPPSNSLSRSLGSLLPVTKQDEIPTSPSKSSQKKSTPLNSYSVWVLKSFQ